MLVFLQPCVDFYSVSPHLAEIVCYMVLNSAICEKPKECVYIIKLFKVEKGGEGVNRVYTLQLHQKPVELGGKR